jgi:ubiquinone/menaquinone biosynthesis C-methylase UbiE
VLAKQLDAQITAVDFLPEFIDILEERSRSEGMKNQIQPLVCSMEDLPFSNEEYDVIWSEGAIYNMGFERGIKEWRRFLKPGGALVVSEITWSTDDRPNELQTHWESEYPEISTVSAKIKILKDNGYALNAYFLLPEHCWLDNYYRPLQESFRGFLKRNNDSEGAQAIVAAEEHEIALYEKYKQYYSYGMYIATRLED